MDQFLFLIFVILALSQGTMILYFWLFDRKMRFEIERMMGGGMFAENQNRGLGLLRGAMKKSQDMLVNAELESVKKLAESEMSTRKLEDRFGAEVAQTATEVQKTFLKEVSQMSDALKVHLNELRDYASASQKEQQEMVKEQAQRLYISFEKDLRQAILDMNHESLQAVALEMEKTKAEIAKYKKDRLQEIDKNIVELVEDVVARILKRKLTGEEETDLVFQSLDEAKKEHFLN